MFVRAIIFDMDGVLADSHPVHEAAWTALLRETGRPIETGFTVVIRAGWTRVEILRNFFPDLPSDRLAELGKRKDELYLEHISSLRLMPGVIELVERLEEYGFLLGIATCAGPVRTAETLQSFGLRHVFSTVVTSADVESGKPNPAAFLVAAEKLGVGPDEVLVIEDSISGVIAAKRAGMRCLGYGPSGDAQGLKKAGADDVISEFNAATLALILHYATRPE
jgi:HAD superfamily hydrolase (TIGR01509 family)